MKFLLRRVLITGRVVCDGGCLLPLFLIVGIVFLIVLLVKMFVNLSSFGIDLRLCMCCRGDSAWSRLCWLGCCSFCVVDALMVMVLRV